MMQSIIFMLHRIVDRLVALMGKRREWWFVFLARLPFSFREASRLNVRPADRVDEEMKRLVVMPQDADLKMTQRRVAAKAWLKANGLSMPKRPEFDIEVPHRYSHFDRKGTFSDVLELRYRLEPRPPRLSIAWGEVVREWIVPREEVEAMSPPASVVQEVCQTWNAIRRGRLVRLRMMWIEPWAGYYDTYDDSYRGPPVRSETSFLSREDALRWRERWAGDERCLVHVQLTDWRERPKMLVERPVAEADKNAVCVFNATRSDKRGSS